ncbi:hypothetical protein D9615_001185 [Tricholomella constricta]|uniref:Lysine-specific metallo-endopeptidase domain-containing protein n=1 Tax=Tricholomella constricta TaxID=117010 RepID=A0A8H5HKG4_9AGAR|nr:hypothetical protein D9615_001185 [Tricholomella constricta]
MLRMLIPISTLTPLRQHATLPGLELSLRLVAAPCCPTFLSSVEIPSRLIHMIAHVPTPRMPMSTPAVSVLSISARPSGMPRTPALIPRQASIYYEWLAGTLIHESSHFTRNGGTNDYAYGHSAVKSLAISNPANAVRNADSHEYFAENNPTLA